MKKTISPRVGADRYEAARAGFAWRVPRTFNIGHACSDAQPPTALALVEPAPDGGERRLTFGDVSQLSNRMANAFSGVFGIGAGARVAVILPQRWETAVAHLAIYKLGAIAVPMSVLFKEEALRHRLGDSGARLIVTDRERLDLVASLTESGVHAAVATVDGHAGDPVADLGALMTAASAEFAAAATAPTDPALLIYTSGTTGAPKGALHAHRSLLGHLPGFEYSHDLFPQTGDCFWTPADWAWIGGLMDALLPSWYHGRPVVSAARRKFDPEWAADVVVRYGVRNAFVPPTALRMMAAADVALPPGTLRTLGTGGEVLGAATLAWAAESLGVTVNEFYGQTEANYIVGNSHTLWPVRPGSMGRPYPGHVVAVCREDGTAAEPGEPGEICVRTPDPVAFLEYWNAPEATEAKHRGRWLRTGDLARTDDDGYLWFEARVDDVISSAGYRIGPEEIEACLRRHPSVALAAAIGVDDPIRGQAVKAFVQTAEGVEPSEQLADELRELVRSKLAAYEYPKDVEFVPEIPLTVTGKIRRAELRAREAAAPAAQAAPADASP